MQYVPAFMKKRYQRFCERRKMVRTEYLPVKTVFCPVPDDVRFLGNYCVTPLFLTVPIGAYLANKYYSHRKNLVLYMILSIVGWGAVLTGIVHLFPKVFF